MELDRVPEAITVTDASCFDLATIRAHNAVRRSLLRLVPHHGQLAFAAFVHT